MKKISDPLLFWSSKGIIPFNTRAYKMKRFPTAATIATHRTNCLFLNDLDGDLIFFKQLDHGRNKENVKGITNTRFPMTTYTIKTCIESNNKAPSNNLFNDQEEACSNLHKFCSISNNQ